MLFRLLALALALSASSVLAVDDPRPETTPTVAVQPGKLKVGVAELKPLVERTPDGDWSGLAVTMWREIADNLNWDYEFVPFDDHLAVIGALKERKIDLMVAGIPVSAMAPHGIEFSQPVFASGYAAAIAPRLSRVKWFNTLGTLINAGLIEFLVTLLALLAGGGVIIWWCEHRNNPGEFGGGILEGLGHAIWWSAVTMTTVGYGDRTPRTLAGRLFAICWMFVGFVLLSIFVSAVVTNLNTSNEIGTRAIHTLRGLRVGVVAQSAAELFLEARGIKPQPAPDFGTLVADFRSGQIDAIFSDSIHLQSINWEASGEKPLILTQANGGNWYAFALPLESPLTDSLNRAILRYILTTRWTELTGKHSTYDPAAASSSQK